MSACQINALGSPALPARYVSGIDLVVQRLRVRLGTVRGTWPEDDAFGLPFDRWIEQPTSATSAVVAGAVRLQLEADPDVQSVVSCVGTRSGQAVTVTARLIVRADGESATVDLSLSPLLRTGAPAQFVITGRLSPGRVV